MIVLTADVELRQIVETLQTSPQWRIELVDEPTDLISRVSHETHIVLMDEAATGAGYMSYVRKVRRVSPAVDVVVVGGPKSEEVLSSERKEGIDKYYARPVDTGLFDATLRHRLQFVRLKTESGLIGRSPAMEEVVEAVLQVAPTEVPILIEGESGTGKDVVARAVHVASRRHDQSFEAINCGALAAGVLESELFGHEKGAFTGASSRRAGMFERAHGGTIFLDEVGETSASMQVKLLRVLESGVFHRVGGVDQIHVNIRVIAATNKKLAEAVRDGEFREDLYYRLKGINLHLPPLRDRKEDIPILVQYFIGLSNRRHQKSVRGVEPAAQRRFLEYTWPGNIRELKNIVDTLVVLSTTSRIPASLVSTQLVDAPQGMRTQGEPTFLPVALHRTKEEAEREMIYASILALHRDVREILSLLREGHQPSPWEGLKEVQTEPRVGPEETGSLAQMERLAIRESLNRFAGNRRKAAEALGISERTLYRKIREYGLV
jgi:DNA-binding NtrC family response regulator